MYSLSIQFAFLSHTLYNLLCTAVICIYAGFSNRLVAFNRQGLPWWLRTVNNVEDPGSISGLGRSPGEGNGDPYQYSCLKNSIDRGAWQATVHGSQRVGHDWATNTHRDKGHGSSNLKKIHGNCTINIWEAEWKRKHYLVNVFCLYHLIYC